MAAPSILTAEEVKDIIPENYKYIQSLSEGAFGQVVKCLKKDTNEEVAVKLPYFEQDTEEEIRVMGRIRRDGLDQRNIVKYFEAFDTPLGKALVFEMLDISLFDYLVDHCPMPFRDIRPIVQQMATALVALKSVGILHTDIKLDNIMLCDQRTQPLKIKLIDFGLALHRTNAEQGMTLQLECCRAPELILGLPFNEAIDVWSLGICLASLALGGEIFPDRTEFESLKVMIKLFGQLPDHMLNQGTKSDNYFSRSIAGGWRLMTDEEIEERFDKEILTCYTEEFSSLSEFMEVHVQVNGMEETKELETFIDLLNQMFEMDPTKRITPEQILQHPFICNTPYCSEESGEEESQEGSTSQPRVILVKPAAPENTVPLIETDDQKYFSVLTVIKDTPEMAKDVDTVQDDTESSQRVIMVKPAPPETRSSLDGDREHCVSEQSGPEKTAETPQPVSPVHSPPVAFSSVPRVILNEAFLKPETRSNVCSSDYVSEPWTSGVTAKKKNCFRRFFSWMKKNLCCFHAHDEEQ